MSDFLKHDDFVVSVSQCELPSESAILAYQNTSAAMEAKLNQKMREMPNIEELIGKGNMDQMISNHQNHAEFMISIFRQFDPEVFIQTLYWVFRTYTAHGFQSSYWEYQLNGWLELMQEHLTADQFDELAPVYYWMLEHMTQLLAGAVPKHLE